MKTLLSLFDIDLKNQNLVRAQVASYTKQVPLLYFVLCVNAISVAFTHYAVAPAALTLLVPACIVVLCIARFAAWLRVQGVPLSDEACAARMKLAVVMSVTTGAVFLAWSLALYAYGNATTRSHLDLAVGLTAISCLFGLMHLRAAALALVAVVVVPYSVFLILTDDVINVTVGINLLLVTGALLYVVFGVSRDFESMVNNEAQAERLSDENMRLASIDSLTGLPNRRKFFIDLDAELEHAETQDLGFAVGLIDLDGFKSVNDLYGHTAGDRLLREVSDRLQMFASDEVAIARLGGDEFGVLLRGKSAGAELVALGDTICAALRAPISDVGAMVTISGSVGFARYPDAGRTRDVLFERADYAMYHGKQSRRGHVVIFDPSHEADIRSHNATERCLREADLETELSVSFQPVFDAVRGRPVAFEALARWNSPELGSVPPDVFIAVAERNDLISQMTSVLLRKALTAAKTWPPQIRVSFNLSVRDLLSPTSILQIVSIVRASGVAAERIDFEVTETAFIGDFERAQESIRVLKALGVRIALDDFGTGYSSLSYVHRLPLDEIKIDRSFVAGVEEPGVSRTIVWTVVDLCRRLDIDCVVEGAETDRQVANLLELGCELIQGYFFGRPMPAAQVADYLAASGHSAPLERVASLA